MNIFREHSSNKELDSNYRLNTSSSSSEFGRELSKPIS
jgi:hypothetical protein